MAWISRTRPTTSRTLRLWTWPMKSQVNRSRCASCLVISASDRFSPTSRTPPSCNAGRSSASTYLVAARISTSGPTRSRTSARFSAIRAGSSKQPHHPLPAGDAVVTAVREVAVLGADRTLASNGHLLDAARAKRPLGAQPQVGASVADDVLTETPGQRAGHVLAHRVAARSRPGPDRGHRLAAHGRHTGLDHAALDATPAGVQQRQPAAVGGCDRDRQAVGGEQRQRPAAAAGDQAVRLGERLGTWLQEASEDGPSVTSR